MKHRDKHLHGVQVGVMTLITLRLYSYVRDFPVHNLDFKSMKSAYPTKDEISTMLHKKFGAYGDEVEKEYLSKFMDWEEKKREIEHIIENWDKLWGALDPYLRPIEPVEEALRKSGSATTYEDLGKSRDEALDMLLNARYIRGRYTILDLAHDLGILDDAAEIIL
jgi:glycerol-1-phosphate dehydrogenase [NAD(P)+]